MAKGKVIVPIEGIPVEMSGELSAEEIRELRGWDMESRRHAGEFFKERVEDVRRDEKGKMETLRRNRADMEGQLVIFQKGPVARAIKKRLKELDEETINIRRRYQGEVARSARAAVNKVKKSNREARGSYIEERRK